MNKLQEEVERGIKAQEWLENPIFKEAWMMRRAELYNAIETTKWYQRKVRDEIWRQLQTLNAIENYMNGVVSDGKVAKHKMLDMARMKNVVGL